MPISSNSSSEPRGDLPRIARAIRFALVLLVVGLSYFSVRCSLSIGAAERMFVDMLGGMPLPALTTFVLSMRTPLVVVSLLLPLATIAMLFVRDLLWPFYLIGVAGFASIIQFIVLFHAFFAPLERIISGMSGATP